MKTRLAVLALVALSLVVVTSLRAADDKAVTPALKCPVSGKAVDPSKTVEFNGGKVAFCCDGCPGAFKKDTAKFAAKANLQLAQSGQLTEIACPLSGKALDPDTALDVSGAKVAFCCNKCKGAIAKMSPDEQVAKIFSDTSKSYEPTKK